MSDVSYDRQMSAAPERRAFERHQVVPTAETVEVTYQHIRVCMPWLQRRFIMSAAANWRKVYKMPGVE